MSDWIRSQWDYFVITPPAETPISVTEAKAFMRIDFDTDDTLIGNLIEAAVECGQSITRLVFIKTEFRTFRNGFGEVRSFTAGGELPLVLRKSPFIATTLFTYKDADNVVVTLIKDTDYFEEIVADYSKVRPEDLWPFDNKSRVQSIIIEFEAGFENAAAVPQDIKTALLQHVTFLYENRGDCDCACDDKSAASSGAMAIYQKRRILEI